MVASITRIANDHTYHLTLKDGRSPGTPSKAQIEGARHNNPQAPIKVDPGYTTASEQTNAQTGARTVDSTTIIDTQGIRDDHPDKTGVTTLVHELDHNEAVREGKDPAAGDKPTSQTGTAEQAGQSVSRESADISRAQAEKEVDEILKNGESNNPKPPL